MKTIKEAIREDFHRDLYWTRIVFLSDDETKRTSVLVCATEEYLNNLYASGNQQLTQADFDKWLNTVIAKWSALKEKLFEKDVHYDVYANTEKGEANGIDYLLTIKI